MGEEELMKMAPGAKALSGRVPEQDPGDPPKLVFDGGGDRNRFWKKYLDIRNFLSGG